MDSDVRRDLGIALGGLAPVVVASALVGLRDSMSNANVALVLVVLVMVAASFGGRLAGVAAALSATASFDFFHTLPYERLTVASADDVETTVLLLAVSLLTAELAAWARREREAASRTVADMGRIHRVAARAAQGGEPADVIQAAQAELTALLTLQSCRFEAPPFDAYLPEIDRAGDYPKTVWRLAADGFELPPVLTLPVLGRGQLVGRFVLGATPGAGVTLDRRVVAVAIADQVGAVLAPSWTARRGDPES